MERNNKYETVIRDESILNIVIALFIASYTIRNIFGIVLSSPARMTAIVLYVCLLGYFLLHKLSLQEFVRLAFPVLILWCLLAITWFLYPERHSFYRNSLYQLWNLGFPIYNAYIAAVCLLQKDKKQFYYIFKLVAYLVFFYSMFKMTDVVLHGVWTRGSIYNGEIVSIQSNYNLNWGYELYIACIIFFSCYLVEKKKRYLFFAIAGIISIFLYGSRGPMLLFLAYVILFLTFYSGKKQSVRIIAASFIVILLFILAGEGILQNLILKFADTFHISSRTLEKLADNSISDSSGRYLIYALIFEKIMQSPLYGWGIYGDRYFLNYIVQGGSAYSHNVFLEMLMTFGVFGAIFLLWMGYSWCRYFMETETMKERAVMLITVGGCLPLLLSLTFWDQPLFWVLMAILLNCTIERIKIGSKNRCKKEEPDYF